MAFSVVGSQTYNPSSSLTSRTITVPACQDGDAIFIIATCAGGAATCTVTGGTGYTAETKITGSGFSSFLFHKINAEAGDGGDVLTFATNNAYRLGIMVVVLRGVMASSAFDGSIIKAGPTVSLTPSAGSAGTATQADVVLQMMGAGGDLSTTTDVSAAGSVTEIAQSIDTGAAGAITQLAVYKTVAASGSYGGNTFTITQSATPSNVPSVGIWTIPLKLIAAATTVKPSTTPTNSGWTAVGAATVHAALSDASDTTYAQTGTNPAGSAFVVGFPEIATGNVTVRVRSDVDSASPAISRLVELMQGATVIADDTFTPTTTKGWHEFTTTSGETATITDRTALRLRITDTV